MDSLFIVRFDHSGLLPQNSGKRGGVGSHFISPVCGGERKGDKGHPRITSFAVQSQTIHTWSDRASNYFVSGEDNMKPGSIPGGTIPILE